MSTADGIGYDDACDLHAREDQQVEERAETSEVFVILEAIRLGLYPSKSERLYRNRSGFLLCSF